ncbi:MAG TPA: phosphatase PAP2 family protein [Candidatus Limnocylindria bacterium]|nr:phosphatase PAP2 family protein [Candidatus Limnocylindria bacterium]
MRAPSTAEPRLALAALLALCVTLALGAFVSGRPALPLDVDAAKVRGEAIPLAVFFTTLGRWPVLLLLGAAALTLAASLRTGVAAVAVILVAQLLSQGANTLLKLAFHRARPDAWLRIREVDFSYPSGHAVTAALFFLGLALLASQAPLPRPFVSLLVALLALCVIGLPWSRLALGAHYLTDVVGGFCFGLAWLCVVAVALVRLAARS